MIQQNISEYPPLPTRHVFWTNIVGVGFVKSPFRISIALLLWMLLAVFAGSRLASAQAPIPDLPYVLVDTADNSVLAENRMHERWHPASLTKLMTSYVVFRAIQAGEIQLGSPVTITPNAAKTPPGKMGYKAGTQLRFDMALRALIVKSANDIAVALAESLAGTVPAFVDRMNYEAQRLGLSNTHFANPNGLHDRKQYVSARDLVVLSSAIWNEFPQYREIFETPTITDGKKSYTSYNLLLERFEGTTGMKTGFICAAGYNIVASVERGGRRLVAVVLGAGSQGERAEIAASLILKGFETNSSRNIADLPTPATPVGPADMRKILCTEKAIKNRYDPASETAVLKSPILNPRKVTTTPFEIRLDGIDADPSPAWQSRGIVLKKIPIPTRRPDIAAGIAPNFNPNAPKLNVDGETLTAPTLRGSIPLPTRKPLQPVLVQ